jgi:hypothetical protein
MRELSPRLTPDEIQARCKWAIDKGIKYDLGKLPGDNLAWRARPLKARGKDKSHFDVFQGIHDVSDCFMTLTVERLA